MDDQIKSLQRCPGTFGRRRFMQAGLTGLWSLGLADLLKLEAQAAAVGKAPSRQKSIIVLWLWGGPSHMETFDLKPEAPSAYRGEFNPIKTNVPGIEISEYLPRLARLADQFALIRDVHHGSTGHANSSHTMMTAYPGERVEVSPFKPKYPDFHAVVNRVVGDWSHQVPPAIVLPRQRYQGSAYLGAAVDPLKVTGDPNKDDFTVAELQISASMRRRLRRRARLLERFDTVRREIDSSGMMEALDAHQRRALSVLTSDKAAKAFRIQEEPAKLRDRYGRNPIAQRLLLARRLVEAGSRIVTVDFPCMPGQKAFSWDDHASVWNIFEQMKIRLPPTDQMVSAMIEDLHDRGMQDDVLFLVLGEMSRTPKMSNFKGQPGREHWARSMSVFVSGGGLRMGQVVGATNELGAEPLHVGHTPNDLLATWYHSLGVPLDTTFTDNTGKPVPILPHGEPISELI